MQSEIKFQWQPNWKILAVSAVFIPLALLACYWQITRADEKRQMLDQRAAAMSLQAEAITDVVGIANYRPVSASGAWSEEYFLLENKLRGGKPGYEVLGVLNTNGEKLLVNRGWVEGSYDRSLVPKVEFSSGPVLLRGYAYRSESKPFTLGETVWANSWPERVQAIEWDKLEARLGVELFPYLLRLDVDSQEALTTGWPIVSIKPGKHIGYAVQWILIALALVVLTVFANSNLYACIDHKQRKKDLQE